MRRNRTKVSRAEARLHSKRPYSYLSVPALEAES